MSDRKTIAIQNAKLLKAFKLSAEGQSFVAVAAAFFKHALTTGLATELAKKRSQWKPLSARYAAWKRRHGYGEGAWEMTGGTLKAITNNPPERVGTKRRLQFGINFYKNFAFIRPRAFKKQRSGSWVELSNGVFVTKVLAVLKYGNRVAKVASYEAKTGKDAGIKRGRTEGHLPPRNLFDWVTSWYEAVERDVEIAMAKEFTAKELPTKKK